MKFICSKQDITKAIGIVIRATGFNIQKSILECIHIEAKNNCLTVRATDTLLAIKTTIPADVHEEGITAIPSKLLYEIINKFPDDEITFESSGENGIFILCRNSKFQLQEMNADEFPDFPEIENGKSVSLKERELKKMIDGTIFSVYGGDDKPLLTGELVECENSSINIVALDGIRLALRKAECKSADEFKFVVPAKAMKEISKILSDSEDSIELNFNTRALIIDSQYTTIYSRLLEGDYIRYKSVISEQYKSLVRIETKLFKDALERVSIMARENTESPIRLEIEEGVLKIFSSSEYGNANEEVPIYLEGEVLQIAFNAKYMLDILKNIEDEEIIMKFNGRLKSCVIHPVNSNKFLYLIVPRIK